MEKTRGKANLNSVSIFFVTTIKTRKAKQVYKFFFFFVIMEICIILKKNVYVVGIYVLFWKHMVYLHLENLNIKRQGNKI